MSLFCPWEPGGRWERAPASRGGPAAAPSSTLLHHPQTPACPAAFHRSFLALLLLPVTRTFKRPFWKPAKGHWPGSCPLCSGKLSRGKASRRTRGFGKQLLILNCLLWKTWLWGLGTLQSLFCDWSTNYSLLLTFLTKRTSQLLMDHRVLYQCDNAQEGNRRWSLSASVSCIKVLALIVAQLYKEKQATRRTCWCIKWAKEWFDS